MQETTVKLQVRRIMHEFHRKAEAAYLTTIDEQGFPHTRAMVNLRNDQAFPLAAPLFQGHEQDFMTWFSTVRGFEKLRHIERNHRVSVFYCHPQEWCSLLLKGVIQVVYDDEIRKNIWHDDWYEIFPSGILDPRQVVLRLDPVYAQGLCHIDEKRYVLEFVESK